MSSQDDLLLKLNRCKSRYLCPAEKLDSILSNFNNYQFTLWYKRLDFTWEVGDFELKEYSDGAGHWYSSTEMIGIIKPFSYKFINVSTPYNFAYLNRGSYLYSWFILKILS